jgi:hypothetical protein
MNSRKVKFVYPLLLVMALTVSACGSYDLEVRNKTDDVMDIYMDEFYEGSVAPDNYLLIRHLSRGEHYIEAFDLDESLIMSDFIYIDDDSRLVITDKSDYRFY